MDSILSWDLAVAAAFALIAAMRDEELHSVVRA
jgi:hypothetical protein